MAHLGLPPHSHHSCPPNVHSLFSPALQPSVRVAFSSMFTRLCSLWFACATLAFFLGYSAHPAAQASLNLSGTLTNSLTGAAISDDVVQIDELRRTTRSSADGMFMSSDVPLGTYHLSIHTEGDSTRRTEVTEGSTAVTGLAASVDPELRFAEQVTVTSDSRSQFEVYQPTAVLAWPDLQTSSIATICRSSRISRPRWAAISSCPTT
jgi:hypothetical protein